MLLVYEMMINSGPLVWIGSFCSLFENLLFQADFPLRHFQLIALSFPSLSNYYWIYFAPKDVYFPLFNPWRNPVFDFLPGSLAPRSWMKDGF